MSLMTPSDRRSFLASLGRAGAFIAAGPWLRRARLRAGRAWSGAGVASPIAGACRSRSPRARFVPRAPRPGGLHRRLRAGIPARRRERIPHRRRARDQGSRRADRPLSGRQFRLRLQLARRRRPEGAAAGGARSRLEFDRDEPVRHQRVHRVVRHGRRRAAARHELRHRHGRIGGRLRRVLQPRSGHAVERAQASARLRSAAQRPPLVPRQRDGRTLADRPAAGARVRAEGARRRPADARHRSESAADCLWIQRHLHADLSHLGSRGPGGVLRQGGRHLAARLLRQHGGVVGEQHARASSR